MTQLKFSKMHGLGNDFIVIDGVNQSVSFDAANISQLADRHCGVGFDQLLLIEPGKQADFSCRIFNADGSEAEQCGNGMRCIARFIREKNLSEKNNLRIETKAGLIEIDVHDFDHIRVNMGVPHIESLSEELILKNSRANISVLSLGNPHAVLEVKNINDTPVTELGAEIGKHERFPNGVNVGFMQIINLHHIRLRTYERGAGETFACGSNSCAASIVGIAKKLLQSPVTVELRYGQLQIERDGDHANSVFMSGPATQVFEGILTL